MSIRDRGRVCATMGSMRGNTVITHFTVLIWVSCLCCPRPRPRPPPPCPSQQGGASLTPRRRSPRRRREKDATPGSVLSCEMRAAARGDYVVLPFFMSSECGPSCGGSSAGTGGVAVVQGSKSREEIYGERTRLADADVAPLSLSLSRTRCPAALGCSTPRAQHAQILHACRLRASRSW